MPLRSAGLVSWGVVTTLVVLSVPHLSLHEARVLPALQLPSPAEEMFFRAFVAAAVERTHHSVRYDPAYVRIPYPGGDVPATTGVCTDEVIRAYRAVGIDLQKEVHEDMEGNFSAYPGQRRWL